MTMHDGTTTKRLAWWQTLIAALLGLIVAFIGSSVVGMVIIGAMHISRGGTLTNIPDEAALNASLATLPVLGPTLLVTAIGFAGSALLAPYFAKLPVRETLGLVGAHPATFIAAPIGMLAFGPTSDVLVRLAKRWLPEFNLGSLEMLETITRSAPFLVLFPFIALLPGFGEELFFRGLIQRTFTKPAWAISVSAITFAMIHMDPQHVVGVLPLGFYLAWVAHRTGSTWVTILSHVVNNGAALAAAQFLPEDTGEGSMRESLIAMPVGWIFGAITIYVIIRVTPKTEPQMDAPVADVFR